MAIRRSYLRVLSSIAFASLSVVSARGQFLERNMATDGKMFSPWSVVALHNGHYVVGATSDEAIPRAYNVNINAAGHTILAYTDAYQEVNLVGDSGYTGHPAGQAWVFMSEFFPATGVARLSKFNRHSGLPAGLRSLWDPAGPIVPVKNGVSVDLAGNVVALYELQPTNLMPRTAMVVTLSQGDVLQMQVFRYDLGPGEQVLDCQPRPTGGLVYLTGTPASASTNIIDSFGSLSGPFLVGPASKIAYSTADEGRVYTAGMSGPNAFFTRGPADGPFTNSNLLPFPFANAGFDFKAVAAGPEGDCWWGGSFTTLLGDTDAFICATTGDESLQFHGANVTANSSADESVHAIGLDPYGRGLWAGDGQLAIFDATTGETLLAHPPVPDLSRQFRAVVNARVNAYGDPFSAFGIIGFNSGTGHGLFVVADRSGELQYARAYKSSIVGGVSVKVYAHLYKRYLGVPNTFTVTSNSALAQAPASITFPSLSRTLGIPVALTPVATPQQVAITVEGEVPVTANLTILPPTPKLFTPASQTVQGGDSVVSRLSLDGIAPTGGLTVDLLADGPELSVAPTVVVPAGLYSRSFLIRTNPVASTVVRSVTATYNGVSKSTAITVTP